jgi:DNA-binding CsgD family transcriptional regulator
MSASSDLLTLIDKIYDAGLHPKRWSKVLGDLLPLIKGTGAALVSFTPAKDIAFSFSAGIPDAMLADLPKYRGMNIRVDAVRAAGPMKICVDYDHISEKEMASHPYYTNFLARYGHGYYAGAILLPGPENETGFFALRKREQGPFLKHDVAAMETLLPHLRRAIEIGMRVEYLEKNWSLDRTVLQRINVGVVALRKDGKVLFANDAAIRIGATSDGLTLTDNGLRAARTLDDEKLQQLIAKGLEAPAGPRTGGQGELISRPSGLKPYAVSVFPWDSPETIYFGKYAKVLVLIRDSSAIPNHSEAQIAKLIGLTPAEARLARKLLDGETLQTGAKKIGIAANTARTQLRSIFRKTDTRRQADLIRVLTLALGTATR